MQVESVVVSSYPCASGCPRVSVIVPAYNVDHYVAECIESILGQTLEDIEVIVVNDGSTDGTADIVAAYVEKDKRISLYSQERQGAGVARNTGMSYAKGSYLLFFDSDDVMMPTMLEKLYRRALETGADICACRSFTFDDANPDEVLAKHKPVMGDDEVRSGASFERHLFSSFVGWPWDKLFKASYIEEHGLQFQALSSTNDAFFTFTALALAESIAAVPEELVRHRARKGSIETTGHATPHNVISAFRAIEERFKAENVDDELMRGCINWGFTHLRWAIGKYEGNEDAESEVTRDYLDLMEEHADRPDDFFVYDIELKVREVFDFARKATPEQAILLQTIMADKKDYERSLAEGKAVAKDAEIAKRDAKIESLKDDLKNCYTAIDELYGQIASLEHSLSFRVGRVMTAAPRKLRDKLKR